MKDQSTRPPSGSAHRKQYRHSASGTEVQSITNAQEAHSQEMHGRLVKYSLAMGIRMVCIGLIFVVGGWYRLLPVVGAVLLPWIAVVIANGGADTNQQETDTLLDDAPLYQISANGPEEEAEASPVILEGELADDEPSAGPVGDADSGASDDEAPQ